MRYVLTQGASQVIAQVSYTADNQSKDTNYQYGMWGGSALNEWVYMRTHTVYQEESNAMPSILDTAEMLQR